MKLALSALLRIRAPHAVRRRAEPGSPASHRGRPRQGGFGPAVLDLHRTLAFAGHPRELAIAERHRELRALRCLDLLGSTFSLAPNGVSTNRNIARENDPISLDVRQAVGELPETEGDYHPR